MHRFYCQDSNFSKPSLGITDARETHHIKHVLRLKKGCLIQIFNSQCQEADAVIEALHDHAVDVRILNVRQTTDSQTKIILACAPPKKGKFEFIIEKCVELGVDAIIPLRTKRTEVFFEDRMAKKLNRFEAVAVGAAKQCKRNNVPVISPQIPLAQVLKTLQPQGLHLFPSLHQSSQHITTVLLKEKKPSWVTIFIGPEGDFTADERDLAIKYGCVPVSLGEAVLKVETAAIAAVALVKFFCKL